ncbi:MAG: hypothetical protein AAF597_05600, partial [Bacteroidota bacterium]
MTNTQGPLEVDKFFADETNGVLTLNSSLLINTELNLSEGTLDLNGQVITLAETANLVGETETTYIFDSEGTGTGFITHTQPVNLQFGLNPGGLGLIVFTPSDLGNLTVVRKHVASVGGNPVVNRTYRFTYDNPAVFLGFGFSYLDQELGSIDENSLGVFRINNNSLEEFSFNDLNTTTNLLDFEITDLDGEIALAESTRLLTWTGNVSDDWYTAANWSPAIIPSFDYDVLIPAVTNDPIISSNGAGEARCRSVQIMENATLTNDFSITVSGALDTAIAVTGTLVNNAQLTVFDAGRYGICINPIGSFTNTGTVDHPGTANLGNDFFRNRGTASNAGTISIQESGDEGFENFTEGVFVNDGMINIGTSNNSAINFGAGFRNAGQFTNNDNGQINIAKIGNGAGLVNFNSGTFTNDGQINLGQGSTGAIAGVGLENQGALNNNATINIDNSGLGGIRLNGNSGTLTNAGDVFIGLNGTVGIVGVDLSNSTNFVNTVDGLVNIQNVPDGLLISAGIDFTNAGQLLFDAITSNAIIAQGALTNTGVIGGNAPGITLSTNIGGTVSPGFSPGTFSFNGDQPFLAGTVFRMDAEGTGVDESDQINVTGNIDLSNVNLEVTVNYIPAAEDEIDLIFASGSITGDFASVNLPENWVLVQESTSIKIRFELPDLVWTGAVSSAWENAANWLPQITPTAEYDVIIPDVNTNDPIISASAAAACQSITIEEDATLTNDFTFIVGDAEQTAVTLDGTFNNNGQLTLLAAGLYGIDVTATGSFTNGGAGSILHAATDIIDRSAVQNAGTFINNGSIDLQQADDAGIWNLSGGIFTNQGILNVGSTAMIDGTGILNNGQFSNGSSGLITINFTDNRSIHNDFGGFMT